MGGETMAAGPGVGSIMGGDIKVGGHASQGKTDVTPKILEMRTMCNCTTLTHESVRAERIANDLGNGPRNKR